ncbi:uncharacterized protein [Panulirus ornatus]|uniref:uncharacterized protein n=1 Tax=Panulirus ornatus TaxID=150431 RepID=UPI003A8C6F70
MANIKVAVRVRPISQKETCGGGRHVVHVQDNTVSITNIKVPVSVEGNADHRERIRHFVYDYAYGHDHDLASGKSEGQREDAKTKGHAKTQQKRDAKRPSRRNSRRESKTEDRGAKTEDKGAKSEDKGAKNEDRGAKTESRSEDEERGKSVQRREDDNAGEARSEHTADTTDAIHHHQEATEGQSEDTTREIRDANLDQERVYRELGREVEEATLYGYNACMLAYGQSGSGKTYTILGQKEAPGLAPRICQGLLTRLQKRYSPDDLCAQDFSLTLSLVEIYNERVRDLLTASDPGRSLRVREHPHTGPYVDGVTRHPVTDAGAAWSLLERGRASRSVAPTASHAHSSRSHALLTLDVTQPAAHTRSTLTLVDLAGSERASEEVDKTRLTEGASINRSLVTLGNVISALAERGAALGSTIAGSLLGSNLSLSSTASRQTYTQSHATITATEGMPPDSQRRSSRLPFIPYRDSVLTWLLKDTLGGNAKTVMIATLSPSSTCFAESVATLRYATRARCIVNMPVVNLDSGTATIRSLKREVAALRRLLYDTRPSTTLLDIMSHASTSDLTRDWIEHVQKEHSKDHKRVRRKSAPVGRSSCSRNGLNRSTSSLSSTEAAQSSCGPRDIIVETELPYLLNTLDDTHSSSIIIYHIQNGASVVGCGDSAEIHLSGSGVAPSHCTLAHARGAVTLRCLKGCEVEVSGERVPEGGARRLRDGDTLSIGSRSFTFHAPTRKRPRSNSCPRRKVGSGSPGRECVFPRLHRRHHQGASSARKPSSTSEAGVQVGVLERGMGQSQSHQKETDCSSVEDSFYSRCQAEAGSEEPDTRTRGMMDPGAGQVDELRLPHPCPVWDHARKTSSDFVSQCNEAEDVQLAWPSLEHSSPVGGFRSENSSHFRGAGLTDVDDHESTNHCLFHEHYFFGSNTSLDSSISQPSCASLDSRLAHVSGSSNTYHSKVLPRTFFLDLAGHAQDADSTTHTPLVSPQSPSETRRRWDKSVWPEVERGLRRNQSVPDIDCARPADDRHLKRRGSSPISRQQFSDDREKRQKIIEAVTRRLYPGSGPGFRRHPKKVADKRHISGERECRCRKRVLSDSETTSSNTPGKTALSDPSTPRHPGRKASAASGSVALPQRSPSVSPVTWRRSSGEFPSGSLLPVPVRGNQPHADRSASGARQESAIPVPTRTTKQVTRREVKTTTTTITRTLNKTETKLISAVSQGDDKPTMHDQAVSCNISDVKSCVDVGVGETIGVQVDISSLSYESENLDPANAGLNGQSVQPEPDLLSDVTGTPSAGQDRERRRIPLTPALHQLRRALASLNDPERFSDDSLELGHLETKTHSPLVSRLSPSLPDDDEDDEISLGDLSKDSLEDSINSLDSQDMVIPSEGDSVASLSKVQECQMFTAEESLATQRRPPKLIEQQDSFIRSFFQSLNTSEQMDTNDVKESPSVTDESSDLMGFETVASADQRLNRTSHLLASRWKTGDVTATTAAALPASASPRTVRRWVRERAEKRIMYYTSSEESDMDSEQRPRFRKRRPRRSSFPLTTPPIHIVHEQPDQSDSTDYLSLQQSSPEKFKDELIGLRDARGRKTIAKDGNTVHGREVACVSTRQHRELTGCYGNEDVTVKSPSFDKNIRELNEKSEADLAKLCAPSNRDVVDNATIFFPPYTRVRSEKTESQEESMIPSHYPLDLEVATSRESESQELLKESAKRLLQAVNKDGSLSEASQDAVVNLLKASSQQLASYALGISDNGSDASGVTFPRSDSVVTLDEDYETAQGEESWQASPSESRMCPRMEGFSSSCIDSDSGATPKRTSPKKVKIYQIPANKRLSAEERTGSLEQLASSSGGEMSPCEVAAGVTDDSTSATTPIASPASDACSAESSWDDVDVEDHQQKNDLHMYKKQMQVIASEFTPRTARRLLYTIIECSENSRSEGVPSEPDIIPSDWRESVSDTEEDLGLGCISCEVSEDPMSSSDETMLDTVRPNQDDPQDSLSCVSDDILGDSRHGTSEASFSGFAQQHVQSLAGSLELLSNLPLTPDCLDVEEDTWETDNVVLMKYEGSETTCSTDVTRSTGTVNSDDVVVTTMQPGTSVKRDSLPECVPCLDLSYLGNSPTTHKRIQTAESEVVLPPTSEEYFAVDDISQIQSLENWQVYRGNQQQGTDLSPPVRLQVSLGKSVESQPPTPSTNVVEKRFSQQATCTVNEIEPQEVTPPLEAETVVNRSLNISDTSKTFRLKDQPQVMDRGLRNTFEATNTRKTPLEEGPLEAKQYLPSFLVEEDDLYRRGSPQETPVAVTPQNISPDIIREALTCETPHGRKETPLTPQESTDKVIAPESKDCDTSVSFRSDDGNLYSVAQPSPQNTEMDVSRSVSLAPQMTQNLIMDVDRSQVITRQTPQTSAVEVVTPQELTGAWGVDLALAVTHGRISKLDC